MNYFEKHPFAGGVASAGSAFLSYIDVMTPYLEFATLCVGFLIGAVTLYGKIKQVKNGDQDSEI